MVSVQCSGVSYTTTCTWLMRGLEGLSTIDNEIWSEKPHFYFSHIFTLVWICMASWSFWLGQNLTQRSEPGFVAEGLGRSAVPPVDSTSGTTYRASPEQW
jgi:hypothetical protein